MQKKNTGAGRSPPAGNGCGCTPQSGCKVEAVLSVDDRGQMVLPKDVREKAGIKTGDKLALISWEKDGEVCCISLINTGRLMGVVQEALSPMMKDMMEVTR